MKQAGNVELDIRILREDSCPSLSGRSLLTYHIGCDEDSAIHIRVHQNTGHGYFSQEWISFAAIEKILTASTALTAHSFRASFEGKSVNTAGFLMAVLKHLGLIKVMNGNRRCYEHAESEAFRAATEELIASPVSLAAAPVFQAKKGTPKAKPKKT